MRIGPNIVPAVALVALVVVLLLVAGCGSDDNSAATGACDAHCDKQSTATGCSDGLDSFIQTCKQVCGLMMPQLSSDCAAKAEANYNCFKGLDYKCSSGGNLPQPENPQACQTENAAFAPCLQQQP